MPWPCDPIGPVPKRPAIDILIEILCLANAGGAPNMDEIIFLATHCAADHDCSPGNAPAAAIHEQHLIQALAYAHAGAWTLVARELDHEV